MDTTEKALANVKQALADCTGGRGLNICPVCHNDEREYENVDVDDGSCFQQAHCNACGAAWVEAYTFDRLIDVTCKIDGEDVPVTDCVEVGPWT